MKKCRRFFVLLLAVLTLTALTTVSAASPNEAFDSALSYYQSKFSPGQKTEESYQADVWHLAILISAGKTDDPAYAFMVPEVKMADLDENTAPAVYAKSIISLILMGENPTEMDGRNLVEELCARQTPSGGFEDANTSDMIFSILALQIAQKQGYTPSYDGEKAVEALIAMRHSDNGFNDYEQIGNVDLTGMAMMALALSQTDAGKTALEDAVAYMESRLDDDGNLVGAGTYDTPNANSQAYGIIGLIAAGEEVTSEKWVKNGRSLVDALLEYQDTEGGFWYDMASKNAEEGAYFDAPDEISTYQALLALADIEAGSNFWSRYAQKISNDSSNGQDLSSGPDKTIALFDTNAADKDNIPSTGDQGINPLVIVLIAAAALVIVVLILVPVLKKKKKDGSAEKDNENPNDN